MGVLEQCSRYHEVNKVFSYVIPIESTRNFDSFLHVD